MFWSIAKVNSLRAAVLLCTVPLLFTPSLSVHADELISTLEALTHPDVRAQVATHLRDEQVRLQNELQSATDAAARAALNERLRAVTAALRLADGAAVTEVAISEDALHFFESKVRPLLIQHCYSCHGPENQKSNLRVDSLHALLAGGDHGAALVPGDTSKSLLVGVLDYSGEIQMPPSGKLAQSEIDTLVEWVRMGAPWPNDGAVAQTVVKGSIDIEKGREWWAFRPVQEVAPPNVKNETWVKSPIDRFILAKQESENVTPAEPADKRTLIRRATFDLIGLPPTPEEVEAFLQDESPEAFATVVERLLASPHYGERWGRHWLDIVRYTDSFDSRGSPATDPVNSWRYRDWVVDALNRDMPYNEFVQYQIAGDLIPDPARPESKFNRQGTIATAMLAIGNWPQGDADKEKMVTDIVDDQIDVITRGFLGVTMSCARCHDHKFDPFTAEDYYGLAGIFFSSHILPGPGQKTEGSPILHIPLAPAEEVAAREAHLAKLRETEAADKQQSDALRSAVIGAQLGKTGSYLLAAQAFATLRASNADADPAAFAAERGLNADALSRWLNQLGLNPLRTLQTPVGTVSGIPGVSAWQGEGGVPSAVFNTTSNEVNYATIKQPARSVTVHPSPSMGVAAAWISPLSASVVLDGRLADADPNCGNGVVWRLEHRGTGGASILAEGVMDNAGASEIAAQPLGPVAVEQGDTLLLVVEPRGDYSCDTTMLDLRLVDVCDNTRIWQLSADTLADPLGGNPHADAMGNAGVWAFVDMASPSTPADSPLAVWNGAAAQDDAARAHAAAQVQAVVDGVAGALAANQNDLTKLPEDPASRFYKFLVSEQGPYWIDPLSLDTPETADARKQLAAIREALNSLRAQPVPEFEFTEGVQEGGVPNTEHAGIRDARIHKRGSYTQLGDVTPRGFPAVLAWDERTPAMTGSGRLELSRWVASDKNPLTARVMVNRIWQRHFGQGIVRTPGNFGKLGVAPTHPELLDFLAKEFVRSGWSIKAMHRLMMLSSTYQQSSTNRSGADPENLLFARMSRLRLEAEPLRDAMLAVSGKLDKSVGGVPFRDLVTPRRTIYFRTVRSDRTSYTMLFDAADPTAIIDTRTESTVAPQALFLINNPFVIEQARALADRALAFTAAGDVERIAKLYELLFARPASDEEARIGERLLAVAREAHEGDEVLSWQQYCQILLCSNEFTFVD